MTADKLKLRASAAAQGKPAQILSVTFNRGLLVAASAYLVTGCMFGFGHAANAMAPFLERDLDLTRDELGLALGFEFGALFLIAPFAGYLADRMGTKFAAMAAGLIMAAGLAGAAASESLWHVVLAFAGIGLALGACQTPCFAAVQTWFSGRRGLVAGVLSTGTGVGGLLLTPLGEFLADVRGWREALYILAVASVAIAVLIAPWISRRPDREASNPAARTTDRPGRQIGEVLRSRRFLLFAAGSFCMAFALLTPMAHIAVSAVDAGLGVQAAAGLIAIMAFASIPARVIAGALADRFGRTNTLGWCYVGLGASFLLWSYASGIVTFFVYVVVYGACQGACVALRPAATADHFSGPFLGTIMGMIYCASFVGALAGPWIFGRVYEVFGSYDYASYGALSICLISAAIMWRVARLPATAN